MTRITPRRPIRLLLLAAVVAGALVAWRRVVAEPGGVYDPADGATGTVR